MLALLCWLAAPRVEAAEIAAGMPLSDALLELQARGLKLVWSSAVVRPEMRVATPPRGDDLRSLLDQLLAPHGLAAEEAPGGSLVVAPAARPAGVGPALLRGSVRSRRGLAPVAGVSVLLLERGLEATTDREGRFEFAQVEPGAYTLEARRPGFIIEQREAVGVVPGGAVEVDFVLQPAPLSEEEITVHPSRISLLQDQPAAPLALSREEILTLPHLGGDVFRALSLLPGTASNDITAQFHVRGGRRDEVLVLLDGQELYEAYHLKDFDNALSVVPASSLANLDLSTGAFAASRGDRMGAILDMSSIVPAQPRRFRLSLSVLSAEADGSGAVGERLTWLASARRGTTDLAAGLFGKEENPSFGDLFGKVEYRLSDRQTMRANLLHSADRLDFVEERSGELRGLDTEYDSSYLWATHQAVLTDRLFVDTALSATRVHRDRRGMEDEEEKQFVVRDQRDLEVAGLQQSWNLQAGPRNFLHGGYELRRFEADYDYFSVRSFHSPFTVLRAEPRDGVFAFRDAVTDDYLGAYVSDQLRPLEALTLELGARYDRHTLTEDTLWSPRASLAWGLGSSSVVRIGWGHYHQTQRAYELQVEDGDTRFYPAERSEHWIAGFEHVFGPGAGAAAPIAAVRAEVYTRRVSDPRPRYESLFEPFEPLTEGELDRHRLEPDQGEASGAELFLHGRSGRRLGWWVNYAYAKSHDEIDGHEVPRQIDQRHTLNLDLNYRLGRHWDVNLAWRFHTGWPTTPVFLEQGVDEEGEVELVPVLGPLNSERLPDYHRLDLRLSRRWELGWGRLTAFADVQNLYDRQNVAGYDLDLDEETGVVVADEETWPGFFASAGVSWEF